MHRKRPLLPCAAYRQIEHGVLRPLANIYAGLQTEATCDQVALIETYRKKTQVDKVMKD